MSIIHFLLQCLLSDVSLMPSIVDCSYIVCSSVLFFFAFPCSGSNRSWDLLETDEKFFEGVRQYDQRECVKVGTTTLFCLSRLLTPENVDVPLPSPPRIPKSWLCHCCCMNFACIQEDQLVNAHKVVYPRQIHERAEP